MSARSPCRGAGLQLDERRESPGLLIQATSGWRRIVPVAVQARPTARRRRGRLEAERVGDHDLGVKAQALEIGGEHLEPLGRAIDRRHVGARRRQLGGFAARGGAEIDDPHAGTPSSRAGSAAAASCTHHSPSA